METGSSFVVIQSAKRGGLLQVPQSASEYPQFIPTRTSTLPNMFRWRVLEGRDVRRFDELCQYMSNVTEGVRVDMLDMEGRN